MNQKLLAPLTEEELRRAVFDIYPNKAPGADGMTSLFYQRFWNEVKGQLMKEINSFFDSGSFPVEWNYTQIVLLPKVSVPKSMSELRPISLCSVTYKILSKIICNRLRLILPSIVSITQGAFVAKRSISDNILLAHEMIHGLKTNSLCRDSCLAIKTDMSKAYDRVEWSFLKDMLEVLGFDVRWVNWILTCVSTVSYSVMLNGQEHGFFKPERGLRQGDPLSPLLFILCAEFLVHSLNQAESQGRIHGIKLSDNGPAIHHLLFADDSLFMCQATLDESDEIIKCLKEYGDASSQMINFQKSSIMFGDQVDMGIQGQIKTRLGIFKKGGVGSYLGLPECFSGSKRDILAYNTENLQQRLKGWYAKLLSQGGKEILLKSVAMALPVYAMSCFQMPKTLLKKITSAMMEFWWKTKAEKKPIYWVSWESLCQPKSEGGLGFKDLAKFNQSLLAKQAWRLLDKPGCLLSQVYKARYYPTKSFMNSSLGTRPSFAWRSILHGRNLLSQGLLRVIGNGANTYVWSDSWLPSCKPRAPFCISGRMNVLLRVSDLICQDSGQWKLEHLHQLFSRDDIRLILSLTPCITRTDRDVWHYTKSGSYTSKSGYHVLNKVPSSLGFQQVVNQPSINSLMSEVWSIKSLPKIKTFIWKMLNGAIAVAERLQSRHLPINPSCPQCKSASETINHVLFECIGARRVWELTQLAGPDSDFISHSIFVNINFLLQLSKDPRVPDFQKLPWPWILWSIWKGRNDFSFNGVAFNADHILYEARSAAFAWFQVNNSSAISDYTPTPQSRHLQWRPPAMGFLMCNVASAMHMQKPFMGVAWILRNERGEVLYHGRHAPNSSLSLFQASLASFSWALECLQMFRSQRIIFALDVKDVVEALNNPSDWPRQEYSLDKVLRYLSGYTEFQCISISRRANRCAQAVASSVVKDDRIQSYIARFGPAWLEHELGIDALNCVT